MRGDSRLIHSLSRGAQILRLLADAADPLGVSDIAERLHVDPSTSYRLLVTLESHGLVQQEPDTKKYGVGFGVLELAFAMLRRLSVARLAEPHLASVAVKTGETTHLAVRDGVLAVFVGRHTGEGILRVETAIGSSEPLYCTAVGKALLSDYSEAELRKLFGAQALERHTPQTVTTIDGLLLELDRVRRSGYAYDDEELHPGVRCLAAPIRDHRARIVAAFGLSTPATRMTREQIPNLVGHICRAADDISVQLGHDAGRLSKSS
ncbi:MAG: IclR family transcriptional regulator [Candidatus Eremiobacter antarcticus]